MNRGSIKVLLLIVFTAFIANFFYFKDFGFYEDDYYHITVNLSSTLSDMLTMIWVRVTNWFYGHPLIFIQDVLTYTGMKLGGLQTLYLISYFILTLNSFLIYLILKKVYPESDVFAVSGAMMYCLFPVNSTKILLAFSFSLQIALTFLIISSLLYLSGRRISSYFTILGALFLYDSAFMVFLGVPLLKLKWDKEFRKEFVKHVLILFVMLGIIFAIRFFMAEEKVLYILKDPLRFLGEAGKNIFDGLYMTAFSFLRTPFSALKNISLNMLPLAVLSLIIFAFLFYKKRNINGESAEEISGQASQTKSYSIVSRLIIVSLILTALSYSLPLLFYTADVSFGKMTGVHTASAFGGSILFASLCLYVVELFEKRNLKRIATGVISVYLTLIVCYNILIQKDFVKSWKDQEKFWTSVIELCPDLTDNTLIFVLQNQNNKLPQQKFILSNSWTDPITLRQIYNFPDYWKKPPRVFVFNDDWEKKVFVRDDKLQWNVPRVTWDPHDEPLPDSNLIILRLKDNMLSREDSAITIKDKSFNLRPRNSEIPKPLKRGDLYSYLIKEN